MILEVICVYKADNRQKFVDIKKDMVLYQKVPITNVIRLVKSNNIVDCINFSIVDDTYIRGKNCSLIMEELSNEEIRLCNRKQRKGNRERPNGTSRGIIKKEGSSGIRHIRENSTGVSEGVANQGRGVQNVAGDGLLVDNNGVSIIPKCSPEKFYNDFISERSKAKFAPCVDTHSVEELSEMNCFGHKDLGFYAVAKDGNICSVLKSSSNHKKGFTKDLLVNALRHNGDKLDCFAIYDGGLVNFYMDVGFMPVCRLKFNPEYAPDGWKDEWGHQMLL